MTGDGVLRPITEEDLPEVLRFNAEHVQLLSPLDDERLRRLLTWTDRADMITCDGQNAGFVLTFGPDSDYDSANYQWFSARFGSDFSYLDRIVVDDAFRRRGLASAVYDVLEGAASERARLVLEVNLDPPNEPSLAFHRRRGYHEVGRLGEPGHEVTLMAKDL
jgi:predicted GNAT superfamily acetyltransferase